VLNSWLFLLIGVIYFYIIVIYFLWKSIYGSSGFINGMSFEQTFTYLAFASIIFNIFMTWTEFKMSANVISGRVLKDLTQPLDFQFKMFFEAVSFAIFNLVWIGLPIFILLVLFFPENIMVNNHLAYLAVSLVLAYIINFLLDYITGLTSFYTESIWGISITKESIVLLFSGALIPLAFFPEPLKNFMGYLPFQYIYHAPLSMLTSQNLDTGYYFKTIFIQIFWIVTIFVVSRIYFSISVKQITVNGG
jgi:ABC-2 type transport system permease protein